jgi:hypothetical protein
MMGAVGGIPGPMKTSRDSAQHKAYTALKARMLVLEARVTRLRDERDQAIAAIKETLIQGHYPGGVLTLEGIDWGWQPYMAGPVARARKFVDEHREHDEVPMSREVIDSPEMQAKIAKAKLRARRKRGGPRGSTAADLERLAREAQNS